MNLTLFAICYVTALSTAVYIGYRIARNKYFLQKRNWKASGVETSIISLFGLILSFTLLLSGNASKDRLNLIHEHVDALSTLYRDASFVSVPVRDTVQSFVLQILEEKVFEDRSNAFEEDTLIVSSNRLYKNLWLSLLSMHDKDPQLKSDIKAIMVGVNNATALHYRIEYGAIERMPWILIAMITICSLLVGVLVGFSNGFNENDHYLAPIVFVIMTSIMVMVILDINNPKKGFFRPSLNNYTNAYNEFVM
ncbi:MAG: hypothetical protein HOP08_13790 [Cyclobacteriaceae bacterium]|nr:hypothetical protein [Cyclobacteriaceae bacterium]